MRPEAIKNLIIAVAATLIFVAGWAVEGWRKDAEIDRLQRDHAEAAAADAERAAEVITAALVRGNELTARVAAAEQSRDAALQETQDALRKITTGKPCLSGAAVRLLNEAAGFKQSGVPTAASEFAGADAPAASDTDVALWAAQCRRGYDTCRGRIDALNAFFKD